jgi:DNA primase
VPRIKQESIEAVKAAVDMVELVGARTQLKRAGSRYMGRCPFHEERTASFSVNPQDKLYYCFGCGAGGDAIIFVRETEQLDFTQAVEWLGDRFRVTLEYEEGSPASDARRRRRDRVLALLERATGFYERYLWETDVGEPARAHLQSRGFGEEVCREFRLGLAPGGATLSQRALKEGFTREELAAAGLVNRRGNDYFNRRLLFPLADARGRICGFQARRLREDDPIPAKYVNSPESELFHKGDLLYGLDKARRAIAKQDRAVVVEGNTDVLALRQAGFEPVVASMGTALTENQLRELSRLMRRLYLCFDADVAGQNATLRGIEQSMDLAASRGFEVYVVPLAGGDPADDPQALQDTLASPVPYAVYRVQLELARMEDKQHAYLRIEDFLSGLPESPERQEAWRLANDRLGITIQLRRGVSSTAAGAGPASTKLLNAGMRLERDVLAACVAHSELVAVLTKLGPEHFDDALHRRLRDHLVEPGEVDPELLRFLAELDARAEAEGIDVETGKQLLLRLDERRLERQLAEANLEDTKELQAELARVREAVREFA